MLPLFLVALSLAIQGVRAPGEPERQQRRLLDVLVFSAEPNDTNQYPPEVREELQRYLQRFRGYRPRPRPTGLGSEMTMVYAAREGYERKIVAASELGGVEALAQEYVDRLRPCYEWEGFHDCPEREASFADEYLRQHPDAPFRDFLRLLAAHRWLCTAEGYDHARRPAGAERARREYERAVTRAGETRSAMIEVAVNELRVTNRCYASDPFRRRE